MARVFIDYLPSSADRYLPETAIVAVDVFRTTTTAVTCGATGRRCYPAASVDDAMTMAGRLEDPLLVGESGGDRPEGFHMDNSPAQIAARTDVWRAAVIASSSGAPLICRAAGRTGVYAASLRNLTAQVKYLVGLHEEVAVIGAGTRGAFREEDQLGCAWLASGLLAAGYQPGNTETAAMVDRWEGQPVEAILQSDSVTWLRRTGKDEDIDFVLTHVDDVDLVLALRDRELVSVSG